MIYRFKCLVCCVLVFSIQFVLSSIVTTASAAAKRSGVAAATSSQTTKTSVQNSSSQGEVAPGSDLLRVVVRAGREVAAPGEFVNYDLMVANTSTLQAIPDVRLMDLLPTGFRLKKGSVQHNGVTVSDPGISADGRALTFAVGTLAPGASSTIRFEAEITSGSPRDKTVNFASAFIGDKGTSAIAKATVTVSDNLQQAKTTAKLTSSAPPETRPAVAAVHGAGVTASAADTDVSALKTAAAGARTAESSPSSSPPVLPGAAVDEKSRADAHATSGAVMPETRTTPVVPGTSDHSVAPDVRRQQAPDSPLSGMLQVAIRAGRDSVAPGEHVGYDLTVTNASTLQAASDVRLMDVLPAGFKFNKGTVQLNGVSAPDPTISKDGRALTFAVGTLAPGASSIIRFEVKITAGIPRAKAVNVASAFSSGSGVSNIAKTAVTVSDDLQHAKVTADTAAVIPVGVLSSVAASGGSGVIAPVVEAAAVPIKAAVVPPPLLPSPPELPKVTATADGALAQQPAAVPAKTAVPPPAAPLPLELPKVPEVVDVAIIPQPAVTTVQTAVPPPAVPLPLELPKVPLVTDVAIVPQPAVTAAQVVAPSSDSLEQPVRPGDIDTEEKLQSDDPVTGDFVVQKTLSLAELIGSSDVSVLSDVDGQFVKNMAENQTLENESASTVDGTNLLESIRVGRSFNRESRAALARTEQANAQTGQAFALLLPSISLRANYGSETSDPSVIADPVTNKPVADTHSRTDASLSIRQPLFDLPGFMDWRRRKVVEQARGENYKVSDGDAYISAVNAYLSIVSSRLQTDMTREFETKLNDLLIYVEKRAKAGAASNSDMARVRARSQATLSSRLEQESAHAAAGIEFIRLTNLVPRKVRLPALDDVGASLLPKTLDMAVMTAMKSNPEVAALAAEIQAAEIDTQAAKGRYLPKVDAEYTNSYSLHAGGNTSSAGQKDQRVMMVLNWTLFNGGSDYKTTVERTARHKELQYRLDDQRRRVVQTLSANYATLATTRERIASGYQELNSISTAADAMSKRMLSGNQSLLDMLDVYDRLYQVRSRLVSLHILEMSTAAQLVRLMHGTPGPFSVVKK